MYIRPLQLTLPQFPEASGHILVKGKINNLKRLLIRRPSLHMYLRRLCIQTGEQWETLANVYLSFMARARLDDVSPSQQ